MPAIVPKIFYSRATIAEDAKVLYALLDAADAATLLRSQTFIDRWRDVKSRVDRSGYEAETENLFNLLVNVDQAGLLDNSWVRARWLPIRHRIDSAPRRMHPRNESDRDPAHHRRGAP